MSENRIKVGVGAITRGRTKMFSQLLKSFSEMDLPENADIVFLFAENDDAITVDKVVEAFRVEVSQPVKLELETKLGIPFARNKVLDMALEEGCDFLTFVDDDELVTETWLVEILKAAEKRSLDLVGGPVKLIPPQDRMKPKHKAVFSHLQYYMAKRTKRRFDHIAMGTDDTQNIYTNNWCARLATVRKYGIRFDESMVHSGGSDTRFSLAMKAAGARNGLTLNAVVEEPAPRRRLKFSYHYRRARDQALNTVILNKHDPWPRVWAAVPALRDGIGLILAFPIFGLKGYAKAVHKIGIFSGRLKAALGHKSEHYSENAQTFHSDSADADKV